VSCGAEAWTLTKKEEEEEEEEALLILKGKYLEEYVVLNMEKGIVKVGRIEN